MSFAARVHGPASMPGDQIFPVLKTIVVRDDPKDASAAA